jgi:hypothetical protein
MPERRLSPEERQRMEELYGYFDLEQLNEELFAALRAGLTSDEDTRRRVKRQIEDLAAYVHAREE